MSKALSPEEKARRKAQREAEQLAERKRRTNTDWHATFLAMLAEQGIIRFACQAAGVSRSTAYLHRELFPDFSAAWDDAILDATDALILIARARAVSSSDLLLMFLLKRLDPTFRDSYKIEHATEAGKPLEITDPDRKEADREAQAWRAQQTNMIAAMLSNMQSHRPIPPISATPTAE